MNDASKVVFNDEAHSYTLAGVVLPSVTGILKCLFDFSMVNSAVLQAKVELGRAVHMACELHDAGDLDEASVAPAVLPYLTGYRKFRRDKCTHVIAAEQIVYSSLGYCGKFDLLCEFDGNVEGKPDLHLIDLKTPLVISPAVGLQLAGYAAALPAPLNPKRRPIQRSALQLKADGTYKLVPFNDYNDFPTFVSFLNCFRWRQRNAL